MKQQHSIIHSLLFWIEDNLTQPLSIDFVAEKSGYSKWHLQRMFKEITGENVGAYVRKRQLSKSAIALRLTSRSILDISDTYQFDSQQSFTRAFKKQFGETPARYRRAEDWDAQGIEPPIVLHEDFLPKATFVELEEFNIYALTGKYHSTLDTYSVSRRTIRERLWLDIIERNRTLPEIIYGVDKVMPGKNNFDDQILFYGIGMCFEDMNPSIEKYEKITIEKGLYVQFSYSGKSVDFQSYILRIYQTCLPSLALIRRQGMDVERYYTNQNRERDKIPEFIHCDYLIPVRVHES
ncbi:helix-turn-helix domain-containing protein [Pantoea sp. App145]|uniref:helix-turn-helix domain-containing protein n=1 Tax=Pantoea sp. App145 TaxID=3071567 RepID=UPI003A80A965